MQHSQEANISEVIDSSITCNNCQIKANINSYMITSPHWIVDPMDIIIHYISKLVSGRKEAMNNYY